MNLSKETEQVLIMKLLGLDTDSTDQSKDIASGMIGKVCMVRTYSAGVHFGELVSRNGREAVLKNSYRIWKWSGAASLSQLAMEGSNDRSNCKIARPENEKLLTGVIEITPMTATAIESLTSELWTV